MHFFGLALDLDYDFNFFPETSGRTAINNVLKDARLLFEPDAEPQKEPEVPWGWPKKSNKFKNLEYEQVRQINEKLINFFGLIDDKVKLEELRSAAKAEPWTNFADVEIARKHIEQLLSDMFSVIRDKKDGTLKIGKKTGIMTISKELHDGMGLSWGGAYGDTMHFDARNLAKGKQIQNAIQSFKKDTTKHKELAEVWKSFIGKNEAEMLTEFAKHYPKT